MDFEFTSEQEELRRSVRAVLDRECPISLVREVVEKDVRPDGLWATLTGLDWPALTIPEDLGGLGLGYVELAVVLEEMGRSIAPGPYLATVTQFVPAVREAGTPEQQARFLGWVAKGSMTGTMAVAEEDGLWPPRRLATTARREGSDWVIEGTKHYVADGFTADEMVVAARVIDHQGESTPDGCHALFVVPGDQVEALPTRMLDGTQRQAGIVLDRVRVSADRELGPSEQGASALRRAVEESTAAIAVSTVGTCQAIFDMTLDYVKAREQFNVPVGSFQAVKHKLADMFISLERARAVGYLAALTIAENDPRRTLATSMAKAAAGECQRLIVQDGLQLHGGIGYTWEHDLHLYLKRAKWGDTQFGTAAEHRARVAGLIKG